MRGAGAHRYVWTRGDTSEVFVSAVTVRSEQFVVRGQTADAARLFERHSDRVFGYCLRCLGSRADAEDAVQTTFLYAHRALERGVVPESEYAWLHSIAKNVCRWQQRTTARRGRLSTDIDLDTLPGRCGDEGDQRELLMGLGAALASIPESQRRALLLREWQGLSSDEIASRLGMSASATYALLTRARQSLRRALTATSHGPLLGVDVGFLLYQLRSQLKTLFAGTSAKVGATVAVVSVAAGGVALEIGSAARSPARPAPAPAAVDRASIDSARTSLYGQAFVGRMSPTSGLPSVVVQADPSLGSEGATAALTPPGESAPAPASGGGADSSGSPIAEPALDAPVDVPPLPDLELPLDLLPPDLLPPDLPPGVEDLDVQPPVSPVTVPSVDDLPEPSLELPDLPG